MEKCFEVYLLCIVAEKERGRRRLGILHYDLPFPIRSGIGIENGALDAKKHVFPISYIPGSENENGVKVICTVL